MTTQEEQLFTITDLKQYIYCARISYYHLCLPNIRPATRKMQIGIDAHRDEQARAERRSLKMYGEIQGERRFDVPLRSERLRLTGRVDEMIVTPDEIIPVDYKIAKKSGHHFEAQLAAYALLIEDEYQVTVKRGFIYLTTSKKVVEIRIGSQLRCEVMDALDMMRQIQSLEIMPPPTEWRQRCLDCEFRRFCNDV